MRVLVHDFSGHPFQAQLSRELARRGHDVLHSSCNAYVTGKGNLESGPGENVRFTTVGDSMTVDKGRFVHRLGMELRYGVSLVRHVRREKPDVALLSNVQIPSLVVFAAAMMVLRTPWVLWHQDLYGVAARSLVGRKLSRIYAGVAWGIDVAERWCARRAHQIVVITKAFVPVHQAWGTADKVTVVPNWAPLDEIVPTERTNAWSKERGLDDVQTLLYSGTLGLKHDPELLVQLAAQIRDRGRNVRLVVVNEGPAQEVLRREADRLGIELTQLPFQPYERLPEVLGSGDILMVLLDKAAGEFSVPSKTLSYLCAGRPIMGLMPAENAAAGLIQQTDGFVAAPDAASLPAAAQWVDEVLADDARRVQTGALARACAERNFALKGCVDRFEQVLYSACGQEEPVAVIAPPAKAAA